MRFMPDRYSRADRRVVAAASTLAIFAALSPVAVAQEGIHPVELSIQVSDAQGWDDTFNPLGTLVSSGVPILEGLSDLRDTIDNKRLQEVTAAMIESIEGGKNLSQAMSDFPFVFPNTFVSQIQAGEESGQMNRVLGPKP